MEVPVCIPLGDAAPKVAKLGLGPTLAVITPCNPFGVEVGPSVNVERLATFRRELVQAGIPNVEADGWSSDHAHVERGNACALDLEAAIALARKWDQLALFWFDGSQFTIVPCFHTEPQNQE